MKSNSVCDFLVIASVNFVLTGSLSNQLSAQESLAKPESKLTSPGDAMTSDAKTSEDQSQVGKFRFETSANRQYQIEQARRESESRKALLRYYEERGINFAQPTFDGMALHPYPVAKRHFYVRPFRAW
ncbi:MAG: hypothetical protein ACKO8U_10020 [Pirellula sp.]